MSKKSINELELKAQPVGEIDFEHLPEEFTSAPPPPYPGTYEFKLPANLGNSFDTFESEFDGKPLQFVSVIFDNDDPLVITQGKEKIGEPFTTRVNNRPRNRSRKGDPEVFVSDGTYFLRALDPAAAAKVKNFDNRGFIDAVKIQGGKRFVADVEWNTNCNAEKQIYVADEGGNLQPGVMDEQGTPQMGCGERYYMNNWPRDTEGKYKPRYTCGCGASLRPFAQLRAFKAAK